jgi:gamma-glutamyl-gamma-aminobutyraldehyde dehydrogenase
MSIQDLVAFSKEEFREAAAALAPDPRMLIDGELVNAKSGKRFETINPASDEVVATVPLGGVEDVDLAVSSARKAFQSGVWSRIAPRARMEVMYRLLI